MKNDLLVSAYGDVDELNSSIGITLAYLTNANMNYGSKWWYRYFTRGKIRKNIIKQLENIQNDLFNIGFELATPPEEINKKEKTGIFKNFVNNNDVIDLEVAIDKMQDSLPSLDNFILPTGIFFHPLRKCPVSPGCTLPVFESPRGQPHLDWQLRSLNLPLPGYAAALCTPAPTPCPHLIPLSCDDLLNGIR